MQLTVYNTEVYSRSKLWYIGFAIFFTFLIVVLLLSTNYIGVITLCFFLGWYMVFSIKSLEPINLEISETYLRIGQKTYSWSSIQWFVIEIHKNKEEIKNLVLLIDNVHSIYTIKDVPSKTKDFLMELNQHANLLNNYPQSTLQLFIRKLKL